MREAEIDNSLLEVARRFRPRILAEADRIEASRRLPEDLARELAHAGFFRIFLPKRFMAGSISRQWKRWRFTKNWHGRTPRSRGACGTGIRIGLPPNSPLRLRERSTPTPMSSPRTVPAPRGRRRSSLADSLVNGRWSLVSGCELGTWMVLLCVVHEDGKPRLTQIGAPENRFMLLPSEACEIIDTWNVGGLRGTGSHDVVVREVFVPNSYGSGFTDPHVLPEPRYRIPPFSRVIPGLGAMTLGIARTAIETFTEIAGAKTPERTTQMLRYNHGAQLRVSQAEALVRSARLFLFDTVERLWRPLIATGEVTMEARAHVRLAASHAVTSAVQTVDLLYIGAGASALYTSSPLERAFRDVHAITQHIGVNPRVMETTGRVLFGLEPDTTLL